MALLKFRIYWEEDDATYRDILIRHQQTFEDLHFSILKAYEFDTKHQATFYRSNDQWQKGREISFEQYDKAYKAPPLLMKETTLGSEVKVPDQKFIYEYDFVKGWSFLIALIQVIKEEGADTEYPVIVRKEGIGPSQYGTKDMVTARLTEVEEKYDLNAGDEGYGEEGEDEEGASEEEEGFEEDQSDTF
ncbi:MAG: hypothetical protein KGP35_03685 [Bacteroidetes bacterium]|nr:hypothetical protein [Bacteroidota bacterium]